MRETLGYVVIVLPQVGGASLGNWSREDGFLAVSSVGDLYPSRREAARAVQKTLAFSKRKKYGWKASGYIISRVAKARPLPRNLRGSMTLDDAAGTLNITEGHLKDLIRDKEIRAKVKGPPHRREYNVNGADVRARKRRQELRKVHRVTRARPHGR